MFVFLFVLLQISRKTGLKTQKPKIRTQKYKGFPTFPTFSTVSFITKGDDQNSPIRTLTIKKP